jgi:DNA invertase Pin-like site-specific DNA recombinase
MALLARPWLAVQSARVAQTMQDFTADLDAARKQGRIGGRRPKLKKHQQEEIVSLVNSGQKTQRMLPDYLMSILLPYRVFSSATKFLNRVLRSIAP